MKNRRRRIDLQLNWRMRSDFLAAVGRTHQSTRRQADALVIVAISSVDEFERAARSRFGGRESRVHRRRGAPLVFGSLRTCRRAGVRQSARYSNRNVRQSEQIANVRQVGRRSGSRDRERVIDVRRRPLRFCWATNKVPTLAMTFISARVYIYIYIEPRGPVL